MRQGRQLEFPVAMRPLTANLPGCARMGGVQEEHAIGAGDRLRHLGHKLMGGNYARSGQAGFSFDRGSRFESGPVIRAYGVAIPNDQAGRLGIGHG